MFPEVDPKVAVIFVAPVAMVVASPLLLTVAVNVFEELQVTCVVMVWVDPSRNVPVAVNCWVPPTDRIGLAGVTTMEVKGAEVTVRVVFPERVPEVAVMDEFPAETAVARPLVSMVAVNVFSELQLTDAVISRVVPSENVPVAVNCWVDPTGMIGLAGVTAMEDTVEELTVRVVNPEIVPEAAVMVAVPAATAVARPLLSTVATEVLDEFQVTDAVISWVDPSENVAVAMSCWVDPTDRLGLAGVTAMEDTVPVVTVRVVLPEIVPEVAVIVVVPAVPAVARPLLLMDAVDVLDELQVTDADISWVVPSENVPVAVNCWVTTRGMVGLAGVTAMEERVAEVTVRVALPETFPEVAVMVAVPSAMALTRPLPLTTIAIDVSDDVQVTTEVISPSGAVGNLPLALNCWVDPADRVGLAGVTVIEVGS